MAHRFEISQQLVGKRTHYFAQLRDSAEAKFPIGYGTSYTSPKGRKLRGMVLIDPKNNKTYNPFDYEGEFGFWAHFLLPSSTAESKNTFTCLNTYDTAGFTFGFVQMGAHVPNEHFVVYFRKLLALHDAPDYFPLLSLRDDRIHMYERELDEHIPIENDQSTADFRLYLNKKDTEIDGQEQLCIARMVHWSNNNAEVNRLQVQQAIDDYKTRLQKYHEWYGLHDAPAKVCLMVCDIHHQGRAVRRVVQRALQTNGDHEAAYRNLCRIGEKAYKSRIETIKGEINKMLLTGLYHKKYDAGLQDFVDA